VQKTFTFGTVEHELKSCEAFFWVACCSHDIYALKCITWMWSTWYPASMWNRFVAFSSFKV
jgi:hypothetical protein